MVIKVRLTLKILENQSQSFRKFFVGSFAIALVKLMTKQIAQEQFSLCVTVRKVCL